MAEIIRLAEAREKQERTGRQAVPGCAHRYVIVYRDTRTVCCATCGFPLDPFDVLVDMVKGYVPAMPEPTENEARRLAREEQRRRLEKTDGEGEDSTRGDGGE